MDAQHGGEHAETDDHFSTATAGLAEAALGEDEWAREQAAGATLTLEEAIELARTLAAPPPETMPGTPR